MIRIYLQFLSFIFLSVLVSCTASGPQFKPSPPPIDKADFYIYWENDKGVTLDFPNILIDEIKIGSLKKGGYLKSEIKSGHHSVRIGDNSFNWGLKDLKFDFLAEKGNAYYFKIVYVARGGYYQDVYTVKVVPMDSTSAQNEIKTTKLSN